MAQHSKPYVGSATASEHRVFFRARLKLTGIYVGILALILFGFSVILYQNVAHNLTDASEDDFAGTESHHHFVENTLPNVQNEIMLIDLFILLAAAGVSYVLAGYTLRPIQASLEAQKKFSENASHELRTPLAVMKNDAEVLLRNPSPTKDSIHSTLRSNIEEIDRLSNMAADLLALARSGNHVAPAMEKLDITEVVGTTVEKMRHVAAAKEVSLSVTSHKALQIMGYKAGLERILMNLLQNAIEHTPNSGSISVETSQDRSQAVVKVSDTGSGIDPKDLPNVFGRFYKGERASGTGLGLSIVKELTNQHQGMVSIESALEKGTIVTLRFPIS
jgi:two-component system, OmpR family, sensor histidine kinase CiaH